MSSRPAVAWIAVLALCAPGCAARSPANPTPAELTCYRQRFDNPFDRVDPCDAEHVITAALGTIFGYRPSEQADPAGALAAARVLLEDGFAARASVSASVWTSVTPVLWQQWRHDGAQLATTVTVQADDHPPDTTTRVARVVVVDIDAPTSDPPAFPVFATATRDSVETPWLLSGLQVSL